MKYRILSFALALVMILSLFPASVGAQEPEAEQPVTVTVVSEYDYEAAFKALKDINGTLTYWGLDPLKLNATLTEVAMIRASEVSFFFDTNGTRPDGSNVRDMEQLVAGNWTDLVELPSKDSAYGAPIHWLNHDLVRPILESGSYDQVGIGFNKDMCVILFGRSATDTATIESGEKVSCVQKVSVMPSMVNPTLGGYESFSIWYNDSHVLDAPSSENEELFVWSRLIPSEVTDVLDRKGEVIATAQISETNPRTIEFFHVKPGTGTGTIYLDDEKTISIDVNVKCTDENGNVPTPTLDPNAQDSGTWGDNLTWTLDGTRLIISGQGDMAPEVYSESTYPWTYYRDAIAEIVVEEGVTGIAERAFYFSSELAQISLPDTLTSIGEYAFSNCPKLRAVELPDSVTSLGGSVFSNCETLESVRLSESLTMLPGYLLSSTAITSIHIPESVTQMGEGVFMWCNKLESVALPENLTAVSYRCFESCTALRSVTLPDNLTRLEDSAFSLCTSLAFIELPETLEFIGGTCFYDTALETITIPDKVTRIGHYAFWFCDQLRMVVLPDSIPDLSIYCFQDCPNLTIACHYLSKTHIFAWMNDIPVEFLPEDPDTPVYPVSVYTNNGGNIALSSEYSPAGRYVLVQVQPDENHLFASMYVYRGDGLEAELEMLQLSDYEFLIEMPPCEMILDVTFLLQEVPFTDVRMEDYYYVPVLWAVTEGITAGTSATTFSPDDSCTRAQVVTFLWRAFGQPEPTTTENPFTDVKPGDYYYKAVLWAMENGITAGTSAGKFSPEDGCTRAQVVTFLWRACGKPEYDPYSMGFADVAEDAYYHDAVRWAAQYQITSGVNSTHFAPEDICSRAQIVTFLFRTFF